MAKKTIRSEADDTRAPAAEKRRAKDRGQSDVGAAAVANREPDSAQLNSIAAGPESISGLDAPADRVQQSPGDAVAAQKQRSAEEPTEQDIRDRAYQMYLERGAHHGQDFDDWLRAEDELKQRR